MMKKKLFIFLFILFILASIFIVAALLSGAYSYYQSAKLIEAIQHNKTSKALDIIDNMDNVNSYNTPFFLHRICRILRIDITSPLVEACREGNYEIVVALLNKRADPNQYLEGGFSPMEATFVDGNESRLIIAKLLIEHGADVDGCGSGETALFRELSKIAYSNNFCNEKYELVAEILSFLIDQGAATVDNKGNTVVHYLCILDNADLLCSISEKYDLDLEYRNNKGQTPLIWATKSQKVDVVKYLIYTGVDIDMIDDTGKKAFDYATKANNRELIELLAH